MPILIDCKIYLRDHYGSVTYEPYMFDLNEVIAIRSTHNDDTIVYFRNGSIQTINTTYNNLRSKWLLSQ